MATMGVQYVEGPLSVIALPSAGSNNFVAGDLVYLSNGYLTVSTAYSNLEAVALGNDSATAGTLIPVIIPLPGTKFRIAASDTTTQAMAGSAYDLTYTSGSVALTPGTQTYKTFIVEELDPRDGATTGAGGRVIGRFNVTLQKLNYQA